MKVGVGGKVGGTWERTNLVARSCSLIMLKARFTTNVNKGTLAILGTGFPRFNFYSRLFVVIDS